MSSAFRPEVWSNQMVQQLRQAYVYASLNAPDPEATAQYKAKREAERAALLVRLGHAHTELRPIIALHTPDKWGECQGCDYGGYEGEKPDWPCSTIDLILEGLPE